MKIQRIKFDGFRNLTNINLQIEKLIALVSENNFGKSNVLSGIDFGFDFLTTDSNKERSRMMRHESGIPISINAKTDFSFDIEGIIEKSVDYNIETIEIKYGYSFAWPKNNIDPQIKSEYLQMRNIGDKKYTKYISRNETYKAQYLRNSTGRCSSVMKLLDNELAIRKLLAFDDLFYSDMINKITNISIRVEQHFNAKHEASIPISFDIDNNNISFESIKRLPQHMYLLKNQYPKNYDLLIDVFKQLFPNVTDISVERLDAKRHIIEKGFVSVRTDLNTITKEEKEDNFYVLNDSVYFLYINDKTLNQPIDIRRVSDGTCRVLLLLASAVLSSIQGVSLMCFEEIENSIHPKLFYSLLEYIIELAGDCKIIMTSHSPYIVGSINLSNTYIGVGDCYGVNTFSHFSKRGAKSVEKNARQLQISTGEFIFDALAGNSESFEIIEKALAKAGN